MREVPARLVEDREAVGVDVTPVVDRPVVQPARRLQRVGRWRHAWWSPPDLGRPGRLPGTRELVVVKTCHIVPYRFRDAAEVLRVFHPSRRLPARW